MPSESREQQRQTAQERKLWAKRIERMRDSDLTVAEYAAEIGVDERTMRRWEYVLSGRQGSIVSVRRQPAQALPMRTCANARCSQVFAPDRDSQIYCHPRCRNAVRMARWKRGIELGAGHE